MAAIIISIVALVVALMALPTVFQMVWGKPNLKIKLHFRLVDDGFILDGMLINHPVSNRFLKWLGVYRRKIDDLTVTFDIENAEHDEIVIHQICANISAARDIEGLQVPLPSSVFPASFMILHMDKKGKGTIIGKSMTKNDEKQILEPGAYILIVTLYYGEMRRTLKAPFILNKDFTMLDNGGDYD